MIAAYRERLERRKRLRQDRSRVDTVDRELAQVDEGGKGFGRESDRVPTVYTERAEVREATEVCEKWSS
jgi:hypothetical protein